MNRCSPGTCSITWMSQNVSDGTTLPRGLVALLRPLGLERDPVHARPAGAAPVASDHFCEPKHERMSTTSIQLPPLKSELLL
jgi:hypothetical protein